MKKIFALFLLLVTAPSFAQQSNVFLQNPVLSAPNEVAFELPQIFFSGALAPQVDPTLSNRIFAAMYNTLAGDKEFAKHGIAASVLIPGHFQMSFAVGKNDDVHDMDTNLVFEVASNTKTFITALIMKLQEEGKLSISDSIGKWLPRTYRNIEGSITIEQLLNHSSGIYDYLNDDPNLTALNSFYISGSRRWTPDELIDSFVGVKNFKAGTSYKYSNTNFVLAGIIAERAGGAKLGAMIHSYFIDPLQLTHTYFGGEDSIPLDFAHNWYVDDGSSWGPDFFIIDKTAQLTGAWGAGNIVSQPSDLVRWSDALYTGKILSDASLQKMKAVHLWPDGSYYGLGTIRAPFITNTTRYLYGHGGSLVGFKSLMLTNPKDSVSVVVYMNSDANPQFKEKSANDYILAILTEIYRPTSGVNSNDNFSGISVRVYPNPSSEPINFSFSTVRPGKTMITLYNELGKSVLTVPDESTSSGFHNVHADLGDLHAGAYFYSIQTGDGVMRGKVFIQ